ncbi:hypothetical protein HDU98_003960, partial [Podochytrium sp. JEL0797]
MAEEAKPLSAAERRRQKILAGGGDRLSKITKTYTSEGKTVPGDLVMPSEPVAKPVAAKPKPAGSALQASAMPPLGMPGMAGPGANADQMQAMADAFKKMLEANSPGASQAHPDPAVPSLPAPAPMPQMQQAPAPPAAPQGLTAAALLFGLLRIAATTFMVYACIHILSQYSAMEDSVSFATTTSTGFDIDEDELDPVVWNGINLRAIASLATQQLTMDVAVPVLGFNF